ncbi:monoterpene synthase 8, chloroplastic-like [Curcuma longa]|uniref:monoterpene synthase 8, chloroplastic-like n=1 Tax=Curcuma longa TaxID=136217 RepID=UPI003D9F4831
MSRYLVAPLYIPFDPKLCAFRRSTTTEKRPCFPLIHCTANRQSPALRKSTHNYQPNFWSNDCIQSLAVNSPVEEKDQSTARIVLLKERIREVISEKKEVEEQLQLIDHLQQLGVAYHYKDDIKDALTSIHGSLEDIISLQLKDTDVHVTALLFRLLRQNGFSITDDIFKRFRDENGQFFEVSVEGMLSLHEAAFYGKEGEVILQEAMDFTTQNLRNLWNQGSITQPGLKQKVAHALELPLNWRLERLHTRWFIQFCSQSNYKDKSSTINPLLLEFAKLDFNRVQDMHKKELSKLSRWWSDLGLAERLPFFRDRFMANYLWTVGCAFEPEYSTFRETETKANCFIAMLDDVYDVYGDLEELEKFTDAIERWDVNAIDGLPDYMKLCFLAVFNTANEAAYEVVKEKGFNVLPYLKRAWSDLCKTFLLEAKWSRGKCTSPTVEEYLENGWLSVSGHIFLTHAYCMSPYLTKSDLENFNTYPQFLQWSSMNFRLCNDLVETEEKDGCSAIQCLMQEKQVSEAEAREMIKEMIMANWRAMNGDRMNYTTPFEENFKICAINLDRTAQFFYRGIDRYSEADGEINDSVASLLVEPIELQKN